MKKINQYNKNNLNKKQSETSYATFGLRIIETGKKASPFEFKLCVRSYKMTIETNHNIVYWDGTSAVNFANRAIENVNAYANELYRLIDPYRKMYLTDFYLNPIFNTLLPNYHPLLRFTFQLLIANPQIAYYNSLIERDIIAKICSAELDISEFIKSEFLDVIHNAETREKVISTFIFAIKCAFIGPFLAYLGVCLIPESWGTLINAIIVSVIKSIMSYIFFQNIHDIPAMVLITGTIRGIIFHHASVFFKESDYGSGDIFYLATGVRQVAEPAVKRLEKIDIKSQLLTRSFSAS